MEPMQRKTIQVALKAVDDEGTFEAVIATIGVIDHDGDVVEAGALAGQTVSLMPAHDYMSVPLGKAMIEERGDDVIAAGKFNREVSAGKDWHEAIKFDLAHPPAVQEWSWGYRVKESRMGQLDGQDVRFLEKIDAEEISPVLRGASIGTRTLAAKAHKTETSDEPWDLGAELVRRHKESADSGDGIGMPHHFGNGKASTRACLASIVGLNLMRDHSGESRKRAYEHLAAHLKDAGIEPPALLEKPGVKLTDQVRLVTWQAEAASIRLTKVAGKTKGGLSEAAKVEAIEMATAVEDMTRVATKLAEMVNQLSPEDEVALALAGYRASEARRRLTD